MSMIDDAAIEHHADTWRTIGWVLVEGLIPTADIDAANAELWTMFAPPGVFHGETDDARVRDFYARRDPDLVFAEPPPDVPAFRPDQLLGVREFPLPAPRLNALFLHPHLLRFARAALDTVDVRLYLAQAWAKYTGVTDYEQPLHRDHNHSLLPPRNDENWSQIEGFIYLTDVLTDDDAPTRLVSTAHTATLTDRHPILPDKRPDIYRHDVAATGPRGSFLAYRPDVWHRATNLTRPDSARVVLSASFKHAGADWIGFSPVARNAPNYWFQQLVASSSTDQLSALGIPEPGHPYWNAEVVARLGDIYPGLDIEPWSTALH